MSVSERKLSKSQFVILNARFSTLNVHLLLQTCVYFVNSPKKYFTETWIRKARLFEKTQNRSSAGKRTSEPIIIDGKMNEKSWKNTEFITPEIPPHPQIRQIFLQNCFLMRNIFILPSPEQRPWKMKNGALPSRITKDWLYR